MTDLWNEQALEIVKIPGWQWYSLRAIGDQGHTQIKGAVCEARFQRGPRKGQPNWKLRDRTTEREVILSSSDVEQWRAAWSARTGNCLKCRGEGKYMIHWNHVEGVTCRECADCKGSGRVGEP